MPVWIPPRWGWCMDHVVQSAPGHIGSVVLGSPLHVALSLWRSGSPPQCAVWGAGEGVCRTKALQAESGVICLTGDTTINLSCPLSYARNQIGTGWYICADKTGSRVCHVRPVRGKRSDNACIAVCNWLSLSTIKGYWDEMRCRGSSSEFLNFCFLISVPLRSRARVEAVQVVNSFLSTKMKCTIQMPSSLKCPIRKKQTNIQVPFTSFQINCSLWHWTQPTLTDSMTGSY